MRIFFVNSDDQNIYKIENKKITKITNLQNVRIGEIASYNGLDISLIKKSGLRCSYFYEIANSNSLNFEKNILKIEKKINKNSMIELKVFPHSIYSLDTNTWKKCKKFSTKNKLSICTHLSESR